MVKAGNQTSGNLIGETLEFKGDDYNTPSLIRNLKLLHTK